MTRFVPPPRLVGALYSLAFLATCNLAVTGVRLATDGGRRVDSLRLGIEVSVAIGCRAFARRRGASGSGLTRDDGLGFPVALEPTVPEAAAIEPAALEPAPAEAAPLTDAPGITAHPWLRRARVVLVLGLIALAAISVAGQWPAVSDGFGRLAHLHWRWVRYAVYAEALSIVAYAALARVLLRDGGRRIGLGRLIAISLAGNAMANTVPGGPAWAAAFCFGQFRRHGVTRRRAGTVLVVVVAVSAASLIGLVMLGILLAGGHGPAASLRWLALAALLLLGAGAIVARRPAARERCRQLGSRWVTRLPHRLRPRTDAVPLPALRRREVLQALTASFGNWLADCGCLVLATLAVGGHVPWSGLLVVYGATQLAVNLPITPGGIGVVEGTLSLLLVAYGMPATTAVAAVLLYRIISFWVLVPLGWAAAGGLVWQGRRERALAAPVAAAVAVVPPVAAVPSVPPAPPPAHVAA